MFDFILQCFRKTPCVRKRLNGSFIYSGSYIDGHATYEYKNADGDDDQRIYIGRFRYRGGYKSSRDGRRIHDEVSGYYKNNLKDGMWTFIRMGQGMYKKLKVNYVDGKLNGKYTYVGKGLSINRRKSIHMSAEMHNGYPVGIIKGKSKEAKFVGQCDDDGYPDGLWILDISVDKNITYYEQWTHGVLNEAYSIDLATGNRHSIPEKMRSIIKETVYYDCMPLENIIRKGAEEWDGSIPVK